MAETNPPRTRKVLLPFLPLKPPSKNLPARNPLKSPLKNLALRKKHPPKNLLKQNRRPPSCRKIPHRKAPLLPASLPPVLPPLPASRLLPPAPPPVLPSRRNPRPAVLASRPPLNRVNLPRQVRLPLPVKAPKQPLVSAHRISIPRSTRLSRTSTAMVRLPMLRLQSTTSPFQKSSTSRPIRWSAIRALSPV